MQTNFSNAKESFKLVQKDFSGAECTCPCPPSIYYIYFYIYMYIVLRFQCNTRRKTMQHFQKCRAHSGDFAKYQNAALIFWHNCLTINDMPAHCTFFFLRKHKNSRTRTQDASDTSVQKDKPGKIAQPSRNFRERVWRKKKNKHKNNNVCPISV